MSNRPNDQRSDNMNRKPTYETRKTKIKKKLKIIK